jgi:hypothetical protein
MEEEAWRLLRPLALIACGLEQQGGVCVGTAGSAANGETRSPHRIAWGLFHRIVAFHLYPQDRIAQLRASLGSRPFHSNFFVESICSDA